METVHNCTTHHAIHMYCVCTALRIRFFKQFYENIAAILLFEAQHRMAILKEYIIINKLYF